MSNTITVSRAFLEFVGLIIGLMVTTATVTFAVVSLLSQMRINAMQLKANENQSEFARKVIQNIEHNRVEIGRVKVDVKAIKGVLVRDKNIHYFDRAGFEDEDVPPVTDLKLPK